MAAVDHSFRALVSFKEERRSTGESLGLDSPGLILALRITVVDRLRKGGRNIVSSWLHRLPALHTHIHNHTHKRMKISKDRILPAYNAFRLTGPMIFRGITKEPYSSMKPKKMGR